MTVPRLPRELTKVNFSDHHDLFATYKPDFYQNIALGYVKDATTVGYSGKFLSLGNNQGQVPAKTGALHGLAEDSGGVAPVEVVSTSVNDVGLIAVVGTDLFGDEKMAVHIMTGTTPKVVDEGNDWISVHYLLYAPLGGQTANEGLISTNSMLDPNRSVHIGIGEGKGCNNLIRCPKWQKLIIPEFTMSVDNAVGASGRFIFRTNNYPGNFMWYEQSTVVVAGGTIQIDTGHERAREGGDFLEVSIQNMDPGNNEDFFWHFTAIQAILNDAPPDYERPWYNELNPTQNPWNLVQP